MEDEVSITSTMSIEAASPTDVAEMVVLSIPTTRINPKSTRLDAVMRTSLRGVGPINGTQRVSSQFVSG